MSVRRLAPPEQQPVSFAFTADNLAWAKQQIAKYPEGRQASAVIPLLWRAQEQAGGWTPRKAIEYVADMLGMAHIRVLEVATFYTMFLLQPVGRRAHVQWCGTTPCLLRGAEELRKVCQHRIHHEPFHVSPDGDFSWEEVECLGACVNAPMVLIGKDTYEDLTPESFEKVLDALARGETPTPGPQNGRQFSAPLGGETTLKQIMPPAKPQPQPTAPGVVGQPAPTKLAPAAVLVATGDMPLPVPAPVPAPAKVAKGMPEPATKAIMTEPQLQPPPKVEPPPAAAPMPGFSARPTNAPPAASPAAVTGEAEKSTREPAVAKREPPTTAPKSGVPKPASMGKGPVPLKGESVPSSGKAEAAPEAAAAKPPPVGVAESSTNLPGPTEGRSPVSAEVLETSEDSALAAKLAALPADATAEDRANAVGARPSGLEAARSGTPDNLQRIKGIGPVNEQRLNDLGIFHFDQIAQWTRAEIRWVGTYLAFPGRIDREKWVEQAANFAAGGDSPSETQKA